MRKLTEKYGISILYKELPNSVYGIYTNIANTNYIIVNDCINNPCRDFIATALVYFYIDNKNTYMLNKSFETDTYQLKAIEFAKNYILNN